MKMICHGVKCIFKFYEIYIRIMSFPDDALVICFTVGAPLASDKMGLVFHMVHLIITFAAMNC